MDIFGGWSNYTEKLKTNWDNIIEQDDIVVIPGDLSWVLKPEDVIPDLAFLHNLKGVKILLKGNHDYWWTTYTKMVTLLDNNNFDDIKILHNNAYKFGDFVICGTRGWLYDKTTEFDKKVILRECGRLEKSIADGQKLGRNIKVFLHYPFAYGEFVCEEIYDILKKYGITEVYYGHIHGQGRANLVSEYKGIKQVNISCDLIDFVPKLIV